LTAAHTRELAEEQAALRRVATLVARGVPPEDVFAAVTEEVGRLLPVDYAGLGHYGPDGTITLVAAWGRTGDYVLPVRRWSLGGNGLGTIVFETGRPARIDSFADASGPGSVAVREWGVGSGVGTPVVVQGHLWGVIATYSTQGRPLPADTEARLAAFTELVATAISNADARAEVGRLADEQAALRRVATLVARSVPPSELFDAVTEEVGTLLGADFAGMLRYESDDTVTAVATWAATGEHPEAGRRRPIDEDGLATTIWRTGRPARMEDCERIPARLALRREALGIRSSAGTPIVVEGRLWGALAVHFKPAEPLPAETESRLENFAELIATATSNIQAWAEVQRLADEQAALRRVATLVARESSPAEVFAAVTEEVGRLLGIEDTKLIRYEADGTATVVGSWGRLESAIAIGGRRAREGENISAVVRRTGRPARIDDYADAKGPLAAFVRSLGIHSAVATPVTVDGGLWGAMIAVSRRAEPLPASTESRIAEFTALAATAISNIQARSDLAASRARIVAATDEAHRRVVRDLHDGAQQRLVHTVIKLRLARDALLRQDAGGPALVTEALDLAQQATDELRELAHGILPAVLTHGGLRAGVEALALRMPMPVDNGVAVGRLPDAVEATAYFVVAEALTNVAKHARAAHAAVSARIEHDTLAVRVRDDGVGGARPDGSGLVGLADRLAALDGRLRIDSPADGGTIVAAAIPLRGELAVRGSPVGSPTAGRPGTAPL
jgi:GAF domain-containing protein